MKHQPLTTIASWLVGTASGITSLSAQAQTIRRWLTASFACAVFGVQAQPLDTPLHLVVGYAPGGGSDRVARIVADKLQAKLGSPVVVDNKTGAGGRIAAQQVKTTPTGQNVLLLGNPAVMVVAPLVFKDNGYDPERDFVPVSHVQSYEFGVAVGTAVPVRALPDLLAWLRDNPGKANFGVPATGSLPHFFALMMGEKAQVFPQVVGYRGSAPLVNDLLGGQVPVAIDNIDGMLPQHEAGKIHILAVSGAQRSTLAPQIPTFKEAGMDLVGTGWSVFFAPASMPKDRVERLAVLIREVMLDSDTVRKFADAKMTPVASTRAQTEAMLNAYRAQWVPVVQKSGYQP
jgi:tripartite-type tricarboxylate transporter receptor subunit TctC